jgi:hypothetical protein
MITVVGVKNVVALSASEPLVKKAKNEWPVILVPRVPSRKPDEVKKQKGNEIVVARRLRNFGAAFRWKPEDGGPRLCSNEA